jgi:CPA2 family monovalent cation:H+ antiporter-2
MRLPLPTKLKMGLHPVKKMPDMAKTDTLTDHLIIIGYGLNGKNLARSVAAVNIPYVIIEMNPETVTTERKKGKPIYYGDATQEAVLEQAHIKTARTVVIAISDPIAARRIAELARRMNRTAHIIVRTRYLSELKPLYDLGANEVIPEEFETSIEIFTRVLMKYLVPRDEIEKLINEARADNYEVFRSLSKEPLSLSDLKIHIPNVEITTLRIDKKAPIAGKTLLEVGLRKKHGVTVLAINRNGKMLSIPDGTMQLHANDVLVLIGPSNRIVDAAGLFRNPKDHETNQKNRKDKILK